jgi:DNA adenine methylase
MIQKVRDFKVDKLWVECSDFSEFIKGHKNDFLYCNPPYYIGKDSTLSNILYLKRNFSIHHNGFKHEILRYFL